jgi:hypothetical protein
MTQSVLLTQLPLLIKEMIAWYIWKRKVKELNVDFFGRIYYDSDGYTDVIHLYDDSLFKNLHIPFQYRNLSIHALSFDDKFIRCMNKGDIIRVAILPPNYYFTSGSHNSSGFLSKCTSRHNTLPDFCRLDYEY